MALEARERGNFGLAALLTEAANSAFNESEASAAQQQQGQPVKKPEDKE
jgi:hypothetical protein